MMWFNDPATDMMNGIIYLHHMIMYYLIVIVLFVGWMLANIVLEYGIKKQATNHTASWEHFLVSRRKIKEDSFEALWLESAWTLGPSIILATIAAGSFGLLYTIDFIHKVFMTVKVVGHQWYWTYEFNDLYNYYKNKDNILKAVYPKDIKFDSYMIPEADLNLGQKRLVSVDKELFLPLNKSIKFLVTATDVLHSWAIPALGVKVDAVPGRINQVEIKANWLGHFFGQCSEICGVNHGFMPIVITILEQKDAFSYYKEIL